MSAAPTGNTVITGGRGFLGWHTSVRFRAGKVIEPIPLGRDAFQSVDALAAALAGVDTIIHLAGVNRAETDELVEQGNIEIAETLAAAVSAGGVPTHLVYGNSIQALADSAYGRGKARAAMILREVIDKVGGTFVDVRLPNIFGEHGRPHYNSFVSTFCHEVTHGREPRIKIDKHVPLLHAQQAARVLIRASRDRTSCVIDPQGEAHGVSEVLSRLVDFHATYSQGQIPALPDQFTLDLFNTYRSYTFPKQFPFASEVHADARGELFETVRMHGGTGQTFVSTTAPGVSRGDHFHLSKIERFFVINGTAEIALRKVYDDEIVRFRVQGSDRSFVDMPTLWVHNITNVGDDELITLFWADQLHNPAAPDTFWEPVESEDGSL